MADPERSALRMSHMLADDTAAKLAETWQPRCAKWPERSAAWAPIHHACDSRCAGAVTQLLRTTVGMDKVKESIEVLVPGFTRSWAPQPYEHPIIV